METCAISGESKLSKSYENLFAITPPFFPTFILISILIPISRILSHPRFVPYCLAFGCLVRVVWLLLWSPEPISDFADYKELAEALANGEGFSIKGVPTAFRAPGYPAFLAGLFTVFGVSVWIGQMANLVLAGLAMWLVYIVGKELFANERAGRIALLLMALHPNGIAYTSLLATELLFVVLLLAGVACGMRMKKHVGWILLMGLVFGLAAYVKPQAVLLPIALLSGTLLRELPRIRLGVFFQYFLVFLIMLLVLDPWFTRNTDHFKIAPIFTTNGGSNLLVGNNPHSNGKYKWGAAEETFLSQNTYPDLSEAGRDKMAGAIAIQYIKANPGEFIARMPLKLWRCFAWDVEGLDWVREGCGGLTGWRHQVMRLWKGWAQLFYIGLMGLWALSFFIKVPQKTPYFYWGYAIILYFSIVVMVFFGDGRFHFPILPWIMMYVGGRICLFQKYPVHNIKPRT